MTFDVWIKWFNVFTQIQYTNYTYYYSTFIVLWTMTMSTEHVGELVCVCCKQENRGESKRNDFTALLIEIILTPPGERLRQRVFAKEEKSLRWTKGLCCYITAVHHVQKRVISAETPRSSASTMEWNKASRTSIEETFLVWMLMIPGIKHYFLYWYFK